MNTKILTTYSDTELQNEIQKLENKGWVIYPESYQVVPYIRKNKTYGYDETHFMFSIIMKKSI